MVLLGLIAFDRGLLLDIRLATATHPELVATIPH
jgi:hypothetical protein